MVCALAALVQGTIYRILAEIVRLDSVSSVDAWRGKSVMTEMSLRIWLQAPRLLLDTPRVDADFVSITQNVMLFDH